MKIVTVAFACVALLVALACDEEHAHYAESCQHIIDACHDIDTGTGRANECHDTAHDVATAEACDPIEVECVAACMALASDAAAQPDGG